MILIQIKEGETIDKALRRYKKKYERCGILKEVRGRAFYTKPSVRRKEVIKRAARKQVLFAEENY
jgi:small subunit ribosomal protein S21